MIDANAVNDINIMPETKTRKMQ